MEKEKRIINKIRTLRTHFKDIPDDISSVVNDLIKNTAFMAIVLEDLQTELNESETLVCSSNTGRPMEHPAIKMYNQTIKSYQSAIVKLVGYLPNQAEKEAAKGDEFLNFISK